LSTGWPPPFLAAKEALDPVIRAGGYRFAGAERTGANDQTATAEYRGRGRRIRLVFEGNEEMLWLDVAVERDAQIISRWTDIEWILAGTRLPPVAGIGEDRIAELATAVAKYLVTA
jgi:hypothetical protein